MRAWTDGGIIFKESEFSAIKQEAYNQFMKWGVQVHSSDRWMTILTEEVGELAQAILQVEFEGRQKKDIKKEAIQVATVALKIARMSKEEE